MAMTVVYTVVNGQVFSECRNGVVTHLIPDTLGNVIETRDEAGNKTSETTYWPYGEVRTQTGTNPTPWGFVGTLGYYIDGLAGLYVRARQLMSRLARWLTVDSLVRLTSDSYGYGLRRPTQFRDPSGALVVAIPFVLPIIVLVGAVILVIWSMLAYCHFFPSACRDMFPPITLPPARPWPSPRNDARPIPRENERDQTTDTPCPPDRMTGCTENEYKRLKSEQDRLCTGSCKGMTDCELIAEKMADLARCMAVRSKIHYKCFKGVDWNPKNGHEDQIREVGVTIDGCRREAIKNNCAWASI